MRRQLHKTVQLFKKLIKSKALYLAAAILFQLLVLLIILTYFSHEFLPVYYFMVLLSALMSIVVINRNSDTSSKLLWVFVIMALPFFGGFLYLLFGNKKIPKYLFMKDRQAAVDSQILRDRNLRILDERAPKDDVLRKMSSMSWNNGKFSFYTNTKTKYFKTGEEQFEALVEELKKAKEFIFIETYIIDHGYMLDTIVDILKQKVQEGVDVRLIYDDFGSILNMEHDFPIQMQSLGIQCQTFNAIKPQLAIHMNNRDHRKIIVIDGKTAFTGGSNIADEYINRIDRFGYWKDMGLQISGQAVEVFTTSFLQIWNFDAPVNTPYEDYLKPASQFEGLEAPGYVIPFSDSPTDENVTGKNMHMNMLSEASSYIWISTPYLILDAEMEGALIRAVNNGADVRLVVPGHPDKKIVYEVTKANYQNLLAHGVKIYEYTPGFIHGKVTLSDDRQALVGTVNMDFRSYYYNYECGVWMYQTDSLQDIKKDFEQIFRESREVRLQDCLKTKWPVRYGRNILKIFSPLL